MVANGVERWRRVVREVGLGLVTAGVVVLLFVAYELVGTNITEQHFQSRLAKEFDRSLSALTTTTGPSGSPDVAPTTAVPSVTSTSGAGTGAKHQKSGTHERSPKTDRKLVGKRPSTKSRPASSQPAKSHSVKHHKATTALALVPSGGALDYLQIPAIGIDRYVVEGVAEGDLQMGPGHYPNTPLPGEQGNVGIAGHRTTFGAPFFDLNELVRGDLVYLTDTVGNTWVYMVLRQWVVPPTDISVLGPTTGTKLTLTTCNPRFEATSRLVVRATLLEHFKPGARLPLPLPGRVPKRSATHKSSDGTRTTVPTTTTTTARGAHSSSTVTSGTVPPATTTTAVTTTSTAATTTTTAPPAGGTSPGGGDNPTVGPGPSGSTANVLPMGGAGAWAGASLWGALALLCWVGARALAGRQRRRGKVLVLSVGALVCLLPLWFTFGNVVNLLPANI